jgi:hypothetical protein
MVEQEIFRARDLLAIAEQEGAEIAEQEGVEQEGVRFTEAMRRDWTQLGLCARATFEPPRGFATGGDWYWTAEQVTVFRAVLRWYIYYKPRDDEDDEPRDCSHRRRRRSGGCSRRRLVNIPVAVWLYYGDDYVPLAQARRALTTFVTSRPTKKQLEEERKRRADYDESRRDERGRLPLGVSGLTDAEIAALREAYECGLAVYGQAADVHYLWARDLCRERAPLPQGLQAEQFHPASRSDEIVDHACQDLLLALGEIRRPGGPIVIANR